MSDAVGIVALIEGQGTKIRELKAAKASPDSIKAEVNELLLLKTKYKELTGSEYVAPGATPAPAPKKKDAVTSPPAAVLPAKKTKKEESSKDTVADVAAATQGVQQLDLNDLVLYSGPSSISNDVLKCTLVSELFKKDLKVKEVAPAAIAGRIPQYPAIVVPNSTSSSGHTCKHGTVIFGVNSVIRYLAGCAVPSDLESSYLDMDEWVLSKPLTSAGPDSRKF
jgi:hypothetical protein